VSAIAGSDGIVRCAWPGINDPVYARYHDTEWGVAKTRGRDLFEKLVLESFQAGLSWLTILKKRAAFRTAFADFGADTIARFDEHDTQRLLSDVGIVRNRAKIEATIANARAYLDLDAQQPFAEFVWSFVDFTPKINRYANHADIPAQTETSKALSRALKAKGFRFVGPTTAYALMQSAGLVNDHLVTCHRHEPCARLLAAFSRDGLGR